MMMLFLLTSPVLGDSLNWETAKLIINSQHDLAAIGISVLVGVALLIVLINTYVGKRELSKNIKSLNSQISTNVEEMKKKIEKKGEKVFEGLTQRLDEKLEDKSEKMREETEKSMSFMELWISGETSRLHAKNAELRKFWDSAALWWSRAIESFAEAKKQKLLRGAVNGLIRNLEMCEKLDEEKKEEIKKCLSDIPDILSTEKGSIERRLDKLSSKAPKKS